MNYSPKHNDTKMRAVYGMLIVLGLCLTSVGTGVVRAILMSVGLVCLSIGLYLFIRYDMTTFTYIVMENEGRLDFYIDRVVGKRGSYVCYYPISDLALAEKYEKGTKKRLYEKYDKIFVYNYCHNRLRGEKYVLVFENDGYYDGVIVELDGVCFEYLKNQIK